MSINETAAPCATTEAARDSEKTLHGSYRKAAPQSTREARPRWRPLRELQRDELLGAYVNIEVRP